MPDRKFFERTITLSSYPEPRTFPAKLAFWTFGEPSNPAVLLPTCYGGKLADTLPFLYSDQHNPDPILPPSKYFVIVTALLGGGESSSPSNTQEPYHGPDFPQITYEDNIRFQHDLCHSLGVNKLFAYIGFSMGGQQAYYMSTLYPDFVESMVCLAGSARTSTHNWSFWKGRSDANDLLAMLWTWQHGDITLCYPEDAGDLKKTLGRIQARCLIMPSRTDQFFPPEDNEEELTYLTHGKSRCVESVYGHLAGGGMGTKDDTEFIIREISGFLRIHEAQPCAS